ncbi:hypothetical protein TanjilG_18050 [Lupinus angustifolius]|uniref:UBC core domain-containing protein n=1 Tax=Lupinus angustifolius TaxID=3871 RepID=A0A1J7FX68_LUPAN|nr:hypothetical protein TanjilG_18050 [Lupinus angustifolius]
MTTSSASSRKNLSKIASNRLQKELFEWQVNPPTGFKHKVTDNLQRWVIEVAGAPGTLYTNETYQLQVDFPENYPMEAPQVIFLNPAPLHPHIYSNGHICLELYDFMSLEDWSNHDPEQTPFCLDCAGFSSQHTGQVGSCFHIEPMQMGRNLRSIKFFLPGESEPRHKGNGMDACLVTWRLWVQILKTASSLVSVTLYILYDSWSPAMTVSSICISILSMLSSSTVKQRPEDNDRYVRNCRNGRSPKETRWWFHDDKV